MVAPANPASRSISSVSVAVVKTLATVPSSWAKTTIALRFPVAFSLLSSKIWGILLKRETGIVVPCKRVRRDEEQREGVRRKRAREAMLRVARVRGTTRDEEEEVVRMAPPPVMGREAVGE
jgi:hypothetical protein